MPLPITLVYLLASLVGVLDGLGEVEVDDVVVVVRHVRLAALLAELGVATLHATRDPSHFFA